jgi:chemotaxis protein CheX
MDQKLLGAFTSAARNTFKDMFGIDVQTKVPVELAPHGEHGWDITGLIGIAGQVHGVVAFRLPGKLATALLAKSGVDSPAEPDRRSLESGLVGEVTNIIAGGASSGLAGEAGYEFEIAPPVVVRGPNHKIDWPSIAPVISMGFTTPDGPFEIDLCAKA